MAVEHKPGCGWGPECEHCICGALVLTKAYRFANGNIIAFDQCGQQMPYYQDAWSRDPDAAGRIRRDYPHIEIKVGEVIR